MAQIIRHRKGVLESVASATKRKAELLVVTGSSASAIDTGLLFIGTEGGAATVANKVHTGATTPDLTGANYDTSIDGIPFYNTDEQKFYILKKGGNVEVQATANTGNTGIVSSSAQIDGLGFLQVNGDSVVSGSSQITIGDTTGFSTFSSSLKATDDAQGVRLDNLESFSSSLDGDFATDSELTAVSSAFDSTIDALTTDEIAEGSNLYYTDVRVKTKLNADNVISSSVQVTIGDTTGFAAFSSSLKATDDAIVSANNTQDDRLDSIEGFTSSIDDTIKTKLDADSVVSSSAQISIDGVTGFTAYSSSVDSRTAALESAVGEGSNIDGRLSSLEVFSASAESNDVELFATASDHETRVGDLETFQSDIETAISVDGSNVTVNGNFNVTGTTTQVDSTTVQIGDNIIELNGSGAANGGLLITDVTAPNTNSGSLLWDSTNDYWKAGAQGAESQILVAGGMSVVSGSEQVIGILSELNSYTASNDSNQSTQNGRLDALETETGSISTRIDNLDTDDIAEGSNLYYTDDRVKLKLNADNVISGSSQVQIDGVTGFTAFSSSVDSRIDDLGDNLDDTIKTKLDVENVVSSSAQVIGHLVGNDIEANGITGTSLSISGDASIDGNLTLGGNITIGDATSDTIAFGGEITSDIIPATNNSIDLGSSSKKIAAVHATDFFGTTNGTVNATNNIVSSSASTANVEMTVSNGVVSAELKGGVVSGSSQVVSLLADQDTDFGTGRVSGDNFGDAAGTSTFTGSFQGDGSQLTGLVTDLRISGSTGNDVVSLLSDDLTFAGGTAIDVAVTDNTITINASDASTSAKGIASFDDDDFAVTSGNVSIKDGGVRASNFNADVVGTGISLNGSDNSLDVDYGSTAGTAVQGNTTISVSGTTNEVEITGTTSQALGGGVSYTVGLPSDVTIGNDLTVTTDASVGGNMTVTGNLSVLGTTTTVDSTTVQIGDNVLELNYGGAQDTAGLLVTDSTAPNTASGSLVWNGTNDVWTAGPLGSEKEIARLNSAPTADTIQKVNSDGLLVDSVLTDDGTDATFSGDVIVSGLAASSFLYSDGNKQLTAITPSNAGDVIQWNGSSFVASNELDGGTF